MLATRCSLGIEKTTERWSASWQRSGLGCKGSPSEKFSIPLPVTSVADEHQGFWSRCDNQMVFPKCSAATSRIREILKREARADPSDSKTSPTLKRATSTGRQAPSRETPKKDSSTMTKIIVSHAHHATTINTNCYPRRTTSSPPEDLPLHSSRNAPQISHGTPQSTGRKEDFFLHVV